MRIRTWLLLAFFIVMVLPLVSAYLLYVSIMTYHNERKVEEYAEMYIILNEITPQLQDATLYEKRETKESLIPYITDDVHITLYNDGGFVLYSSKDGRVTSHQVSRDHLFANLYEFQHKLHSVVYKEPVFDGKKVVGFYEITIKRDELLKAIVKRTWITGGLFVVTFIAIYAVVAFLVQRRINNRLHRLMDEMSAFARGEQVLAKEKSSDEIGELHRHFYVMKDKIEQAQREVEREQKAKEYLIATISHDLKTPLTAIKAYAELLQSDHSTKEERKQYNEVIVDKAAFMQQMLEDLASHALLQSENYTLELVHVDGEEFFDMLISDYEPLCKEKSLQLTVRNNVTGTYAVHPKQWVRVADNLVTNAIRHAPSGGNIVIAALSSFESHLLAPYVYESYTFDFSKYAYFIVQNDGVGIDKAEIEKLFYPLYQLDDARSKVNDQGTGLGLAITKQIVEKHGGKVTALSKIDEGACFICSIPRGD
ncbi:MAG TPA: HAMP domain-containing sensor histidine kinase [Pseudogracilibacillus sp.]|nr:HAMP domain-containing sensor histidine kinase [Pseudogracilibacillus sp.]